MTVQQAANNLARNHYENFPVVPFFLPKKIREPIALIYTFARTADDIADEGDLTITERLNNLNAMSNELQLIKNKQQPDTIFFKALKNIIEQFELPVSLFEDLLFAFKQDVVKSRYKNHNEILEYCKHSANPIGRLLLILTNNASQKNLIYSDKICTSLQLINFLQDITSDLEIRNRLYFPLEDLKTYNVTIDELQKQVQHDGTVELVNTLWKRAHQLISEGSPITQQLSGRIGFNIRLTVQCGKTILAKLEKRASLYNRPTLKPMDWVTILLKA